MRTAKCKCGERQAWGEMPPCAICEKCGTAPGYANATTHVLHLFSKKFDQNTGKPFNFCMVCGRKEEVLFEPKCSGCGHSEHKFLCLHTIELSNGEHDVCDCQSFSPAEPDATERARAWVQKQTGRFELDNPLLEADIADLAAFLESEAPRIRADERKKAVREFVTRFKKNVGYLSHPVNVKLMIDRTVKEMMVEQMIKEMTEVD